MKTFAIVSRNKTRAASLVRELRAAGFTPSSHPSFVISVGGDGTYLYAERKYPSIPKILIRDNSICNQCNDSTFQVVVRALRLGRYTIKNNPTIVATIHQGSKTRRFWCTNDFILRNKNPTQALRFTLALNGKPVDGVLVGDGVVVATPFGSTAYFYSITRKKFIRGIGVAFNNTTTFHDPLVVPDTSRLTITLIRNEAQFAADNHPVVLTLKPNDSITFARGSAHAKIIALNVGWKGMFDKLFNHRRRSLV